MFETLPCPIKRDFFCRLYDEAIVALQKLALANGKDVKLRALALDLVALLTFVAQEDPLKITKCIDGMMTVANSAAGDRTKCPVPPSYTAKSQSPATEP